MVLFSLFRCVVMVVCSLFWYWIVFILLVRCIEIWFSSVGSCVMFCVFFLFMLEILFCCVCSELSVVDSVSWLVWMVVMICGSILKVWLVMLLLIERCFFSEDRLLERLCVEVILVLINWLMLWIFFSVCCVVLCMCGLKVISWCRLCDFFMLLLKSWMMLLRWLFRFLSLMLVCSEVFELLCVVMMDLCCSIIRFCRNLVRKVLEMFWCCVVVGLFMLCIMCCIMLLMYLWVCVISFLLVVCRGVRVSFSVSELIRLNIEVEKVVFIEVSGFCRLVIRCMKEVFMLLVVLVLLKLLIRVVVLIRVFSRLMKVLSRFSVIMKLVRNCGNLVLVLRCVCRLCSEFLMVFCLIWEVSWFLVLVMDISIWLILVFLNLGVFIRFFIDLLVLVWL